MNWFSQRMQRFALIIQCAKLIQAIASLFVTGSRNGEDIHIAFGVSAGKSVSNHRVRDPGAIVPFDTLLVEQHLDHISTRIRVKEGNNEPTLQRHHPNQ